MNGRYFLKINGQRLPDPVEVANIYFEYESNDELLDRLVLRFKNPDLSLLDHPLFEQGSEIEFSFGQDEGAMSDPRVFTIRSVTGSHVLQVVAYERNHAIGMNSRSRIFKNVTIDEAAALIARENGLTFKGDTFPLRYKQLAQVNETDIHFLRRMGKRSNAITKRRKKELTFERKKFAGDPVASYVIDESGGFDRGKAMEFNPIETSLGIPWEITMAGMDPLTLQAFEVKSNDQTVKRSVLGDETIVYNGAAGTPAARIGQTGMRIPTAASSPLQAKTEGDALFQGYEAGMMKASVTLWGSPVVEANELIELTGNIDRISGLYRVAKARHIIQGTYKILATIERNATGSGSGGRRSSGARG